MNSIWGGPTPNPPKFLCSHFLYLEFVVSSFVMPCLKNYIHAFLVWSGWAAPPRLTPLTPHLFFMPVYGYCFAFFPQWVKHLSARSPDLWAPAWPRRCPLLLPHGSALGKLSCLHPTRILWRKTSSRRHMFAFCESTFFIRDLPLCYSSARSNQPFPQAGQETERQHILHLNLKAETKCNRINAKSMCWICHRSSTWHFDRALGFKKLPQRFICTQGFCQRPDLSL